MYYKHQSALALYRPIQEHQQFWEAYWQETSLSQVLARGRQGFLGEFEYPFIKYLPKDGLILEAGCGTGKYVAALLARGYQIEGIDYADQTVDKVLQADPTLPVQVGNILEIDRPDGHYAGYISLGVLEHFFDGPEPAIAEAYRVLRPRGMALISVPLLNWPRRQLWQKQPEVTSSTLPNGLNFYQFHLDPQIFTDQLSQAGFRVLEQYPYALYGGLIRDWRLWSWLDKRNFFSWRIKKPFKTLCAHAPVWLRQPLAHMMMFIAEKVDRNVSGL